jgi:hypothetical protein
MVSSPQHNNSEFTGSTELRYLLTVHLFATNLLTRIYELPARQNNDYFAVTRVVAEATIVRPPEIGGNV